MGSKRKGKEKKEDYLGAFLVNYTPAEEKRIVISMDFGSTHCGVAYALTEQEEGETPLVIGKVYRKKYSKEPTCALFDKKSKILVEFGFEARDRYLKIIHDEEERDKYLYFDGRSIKMRLWDATVRTDAECETVDGAGEMQLSRVIAAILARLKDEALQMAAQGTEVEIPAEDALWVLTVPSLWQESDKQFMRKAAHRAGIIKDVGSSDLILALEPECAVISARSVIPNFSAGQKILCLDCGGGTVDICAVSVVNLPGKESDDKVLRMRQLLEPNGGNWGSTFIDQNFLSFLGILLNDHKLLSTRMGDPSAIIEVLEEFEAIKTGLKSKEIKKKLGERTINVDSILRSLESQNQRHDLAGLVEEYNEKCVSKPDFGGVEVAGREGEETNLVLPMALLGTFFRPVTDKIKDEVERLIALPALEGLDFVLLVGGFSESDVLRHEILDITKPAGIKLLLPKHAAQVVQKGAVEYGLDPYVISTRRARQTIGVKVSMRLQDVENNTDEEVQENRFYDKISQQTYVRNIFHPYVTKGEEIETTRTVTHPFQSQNNESKKVKFDIYATDQDNPRFVTDPGCVRLAQIVMQIQPGTGKHLECTMKFASTEIKAVIKNTKTEKSQVVMLQYNNMGLVANDATMVQVPIKEIAPWGNNDFEGYAKGMSDML